MDKYMVIWHEENPCLSELCQIALTSNGAWINLLVNNTIKIKGNGNVDYLFFISWALSTTQ